MRCTGWDVGLTGEGEEGADAWTTGVLEPLCVLVVVVRFLVVG